MKTWVYIDHVKGHAVPTAWEALGLAKTFGATTALVFGSGVEGLAEAAFEFGADEVLLADDPALTDFRAEASASVFSTLAASAAIPDPILFPATARSHELAAMTAMDLNSGVITNVFALEQNGENLIATRPIYEGQLFEKVTCLAKPVFMTIRGRAFPHPAREIGRRGIYGKVAIQANALTIIKDEVRAESQVSLANAAVIVAAGRGILNNETKGLALVEELASVLGGAVGASRPPVEAGSIPAGQLVGQSGKIVSPDLYIALGISGAPQHVAGIRSARLVVAINKDASAPIFAAARYGVVGDLFQILPALTAAFKRKLGK